MRLRFYARKLRALDSRERLDLIPATLAVIGVRVRLRVLPFRRVLDWAECSANPVRRSGPFDTGTHGVIRAVERVGHRLFPRNPCLTEAVAVQRLLRSQGYPSHLRIGVRAASGQALEAHAWVEHRGAVIVGARGLSAEHIALPPLTTSSHPVNLSPIRVRREFFD